MNLQERAKEVVVDNNGIAKSADFVAAGIRAVDVVNLCNAGFLNRVRPVSYTHLDVYKRQSLHINRNLALWSRKC